MIVGKKSNLNIYKERIQEGGEAGPSLCGLTPAASAPAPASNSCCGSASAVKEKKLNGDETKELKDRLMNIDFNEWGSK